MNELIVKELEKIISQYGKTIIDDPRRLEALLNDKCAGYRREINILLIALKENVPSNLVKVNNKEALDFWIPYLTKKVIENWNLQEETARWSVETWAQALGFKDSSIALTPSTVSKPLPPPSIPTPTTQSQGKNRKFLLWGSLGMLLILILFIVQANRSNSQNSPQNTIESKAIIAINTSPTSDQTLVDQPITPIVASAISTNTQPVKVAASTNTAKPAEPNAIATNTPQLVHISPDQFIQEYFSVLNSSNYDKAWSMLSSHFKETYNSSGYGPFVDWWKSIKDVKILSSEVKFQNLNDALVSTELSYYFTDGRIDTYDLLEFGLIYNSSTNSWLINSQKLIKGYR